jgi:hypothetical protein
MESNMTIERNLKRLSVVALLLPVLLSATQAYALSGAIWTTDLNGDPVNQNLYEDKCDVYLNGGPDKQGGHLPDGDYYYQVTDPSGHTLLSTEPIGDRMVTITNGVFPLVQLCPFADTPNEGGVYKVWLTPAGQYKPEENGEWEGFWGFIPDDCKTDNFKVVAEETLPSYLTVRKFEDCDADGVWDQDELEIEGWFVDITSPAGATTRYYTPVEIPVSAGEWTITEVVKPGWMPTTPTTVVLSIPDIPGQTYEVVFGNIPLSSISGGKFKDCDADGVWDEGEVGIEGWKIYLTGTDIKGNAVAAETTTDAGGLFTFAGLLPGVYTVTEDTSDTDWLATTPTSFFCTLGCGEDCQDAGFGNIPLSTIKACKFYDLNVNGAKDTGEGPVAGIKFVLTGTDVKGTVIEQTGYAGSDGRVAFPGLLPGLYTLTEVLPSNWVATTATVVKDIEIPCTEPTTKCFDFGNVCLGAGGGKTLGYWSNKNGQNTIATMGLTLPGGVLENGDPFTPASYSQFRTWILAANATNMAYMLSAQLAAMKLNVAAGFVAGDAFVYAPGVPGANPLGFISINDLMAAATAELAAHPYTPAGSAFRGLQENLKDALDSANNNKNFVCSSPCPVVYP